VLSQRRSLLTERLSKRGFHLSREYGVDPLETVMVRDAMHTSVFALPDSATRQDAADWLAKMHQRGTETWSHWQRLFPLVDEAGRLRGVLTRGQMITVAGAGELHRSLLDMASIGPAIVGPQDTLRTAAEKMAELKITSFPVVDSDGLLAGILNIDDLLQARTKARMRDSDRKRVLTLRWPFGKEPHVVRAIEGTDETRDEPGGLEEAQAKIESGLD
jgi:CBS domain-containing protein